MSESNESGESTPSSTEECVDCRKPNAQKKCQCCGEAVCKKCIQTLSSDAFQFYRKVEPDLKHTFYCGGCFDSIVAPEEERYSEILDRAKQVFVFFKTQRKEIPLLSKSREVYRVLSCPDRDETILRLAFFAAEDGYNAIIEVEATAAKVRNEAYQTSVWSGSGVGANVDGAKIDRQDLLNQMYR